MPEPTTKKTFTIVGCTSADTIELATNNFSAFWTDKTWRLMWTRVGKDVNHVINSAAIRFPHMLQMDREKRRHTKALDENGNIVGYCRWVLPKGVDEDLWPEAKVPKLGEEEAKQAKLAYEAADWKVDPSLDHMDDAVSAVKKIHMKGKNFMVLDYLAVHPNQRNQGIASLLVQHGMEKVKEFQYNTFVLAKKAGANVYKNAGFKQVYYLECDDSEWGGEGIYSWTFLEHIFRDSKNPPFDVEAEEEAQRKEQEEAKKKKQEEKEKLTQQERSEVNLSSENQREEADQNETKAGDGGKTETATGIDSPQMDGLNVAAAKPLE